ncbi:MAG: helix-turn-helix transcriptional regulator [Clostridia bacterium]|nr:helix-turn-helix transcriptional regulator [Clostridia bacterium]
MNLKIGTIIKTLRQKNNVTQEQLANALYVSPQAISRWESAICYPDIEFLPALADYFNISVDELIGYRLSEKEENLKQIKQEIKRLEEVADYKEQLEYARYAVSLYPSDDELRLNLAQCLGNTLWEESPDKSKMKEAEAIHLSLMEENTTENVRYSNIWGLTVLYAQGFKNSEKAFEIASKSPQLKWCRENILSSGIGDGKSYYYIQDYIDKLASELLTGINSLVLCDDLPNDESTWDDKIKMFQVAYQIMDLIYEGDFMYHNNMLAFNRWLLSTYQIAQGKVEDTLLSLEQMCKHAIDDVKSKENDRGRTFKSVFVNKIEYPYPNPDFHEAVVHNVCYYMLDRLDGERYNEIRDNKRFINVVENLKQYSE